MRRQITIRTPGVAVPDGMGGTTPGTPVDVTGVPARVRPLEGRELIQAMQTGMDRPHEFTIRYREGMTGAQTIIYDDRTFDIKSIVDPEEKHRELQLMADEVFE